MPQCEDLPAKLTHLQQPRDEPGASAPLYLATIADVELVQYLISPNKTLEENFLLNYRKKYKFSKWSQKTFMLTKISI